MKRTLFVFLLGVAAGAGGLWYFQRHQAPANLEQAKETVVSGAEKVKDAVKDKIADISVEDLKRELERTGMVVREKASQVGAVLADATANARTTAMIKAKLFTDLGKVAMTINVDTQDGLVTLSGSANTHEEIAKAVQIAMGTDGVRKVVSTVQVKAAQPEAK